MKLKLFPSPWSSLHILCIQRRAGVWPSRIEVLSKNWNLYLPCCQWGALIFFFFFWIWFERQQQELNTLVLWTFSLHFNSLYLSFTLFTGHWSFSLIGIIFDIFHVRISSFHNYFPFKVARNMSLYSPIISVNPSLK